EVATGEGWYPIFGEDRMPIVTLTPTNLQKMEFYGRTAEGPSRVTIVTGKIPLDWAAAGALDRTTSENRVMRVLVDPALAIDKFRKAVATVTIGGISRQGFDPDLVGAAIPRSRSEWIINDAQASFDDEAGRVQLVIDATVTALAEEV